MRLTFSVGTSRTSSTGGAEVVGSGALRSAAMRSADARSSFRPGAFSAFSGRSPARVLEPAVAIGGRRALPAGCGRQNGRRSRESTATCRPAPACGVLVAGARRVGLTRTRRCFTARRLRPAGGRLDHHRALTPKTGWRGGPLAEGLTPWPRTLKSSSDSPRAARRSSTLGLAASSNLQHFTVSAREHRADSFRSSPTPSPNRPESTSVAKVDLELHLAGGVGATRTFSTIFCAISVAHSAQPIGARRGLAPWPPATAPSRRG